MKQEDKELLLKDLCARLPYGVKCVVEGLDDCTLMPSDIEEEREIKPYLRPMSSMTLEELEEYRRFGDHIRDAECKIHIANYEQIDWLNKNMFDYRNLIQRGLAIEVIKSNNTYEN